MSGPDRRSRRKKTLSSERRDLRSHEQPRPRGRARTVTSLVAGTLIAIVNSSFAEIYTIAPEPSWATPLPCTVPVSSPTNELANGIYYFLTDEFIRQATEESYGQFARHIVNETGVQHGSEIRIVIDPEYETLALHKVDVLRDGTWTQRLEPDLVSTLQRETDLDNFILDGRITVIVRLPDVRVGDVICYSFTRTGANPVMGGHFYDSLEVGFDEPIETIRHRIETDPTRPLHVRRHATDIAETLTENLLEWRIGSPAVIRSEDDVPPWINVYPWIEISDFNRWSEVVEWAIPLYDFQQALPPALEAEITRIGGLPTTEAQVSAALAWVQNEVRYFGVETGVNSHQPRPAAEVFGQRFGDCKEKLNLFGNVLARLGITVHPILVNTRWQRGVREALPSPYAFNHVIAEVILPNASYFLDPTRPLQRGPLDQLYIPPYGFGLRIKPGETELCVVEPRPASLGKIHVRQTFNVPPTSSDDPAVMTIVTTSTGSQAERKRRWLRESSARQVQEDYLNYYAKDYPHVTTTAELEIQDDTDANTLIVRESYEIASFWVDDADDPMIRRADFHQPELENQLNWPAQSKREWPYELPWPRDFEFQTRINLPEEWPSDESDFRVRNAWFDFSYVTKTRNQTVEIDAHYRGLVRSVPAADTAAYQAAARKSWDAIWFSLSSDRRLDENGPWKFSPIVAALLLAITIGCAFGIWRLFRTDPRPPPPLAEPVNSRLVGLRGWLFLVGFGVVVSPAVMIPEVGPEIVSALNQHQWDAFTAEGWNGETLAHAGFYFSVIAGLLTLFFFHVALIPLFLGRYRIFPAAYIAVAAATNVYLAHVVIYPRLMLDGFGSEADDFAELGFSLISFAVWTAYMLKSRRVKATFRRHCVPTLPGSAPAPSASRG